LNEGYWLAQGSYSASDSIYTKGYGTNNVLDNMMKAGTAKKTICVTPTYYLDENETQDGNFGKELTEDLMPYIAEHYNTYAADSSAASLKANRDHQGYVGLSLGSMYSFSYIWTDYLDYFSYIGSFSGSSMGEDSWEQIVTNKNTKFKDLSIKYWYVGLGTSENSDTYPGDPFTAYRTLVKGISSLQSGSDLSAGDNCEFVYCNKTGHNYATWITCLYNCMQVFFKA
jgi:S-formylglutathione hydrolase FrmB